MTKHTPDPWVAHFSPVGTHGEEVASIIQEGSGSTGGYIADVYRGHVGSTDTSPEEYRANAHLIAAAPGMLRALKAMDAFWTQDFPDGPDGSRKYLGGIGEVSEDTMNVWRQIRAAIGKATPA